MISSAGLLVEMFQRRRLINERIASCIMPPAEENCLFLGPKRQATMIIVVAQKIKKSGSVADQGVSPFLKFIMYQNKTVN
jgi:hypothetical protein